MKCLTKKEISLLAGIGGKLHCTLTFLDDSVVVRGELVSVEKYQLVVHIKGVDYLVADSRQKVKVFKAVKTARRFVRDVAGIQAEVELKYKTEKIVKRE